MARWAPLQERLASVEDRTTLTWAELDQLVGGLPRSAYEYAAFWAGERSSWTGFATTDVHVGRSVTFARRAGRQASDRSPRPTTTTHVATTADVLLIGCVKSKLDHPAPARDLYVSPLFRKARAYAEAAAVPWFVLSAQHGLVSPTTVLEPYELRLSQTPSSYRTEWGRKAITQLEAAVGPLAGKTVEIHAGAAYSDAIRGRLQALGAVVVEPLSGRRQGERLAWYAGTGSTAHPTTAPGAVAHEKRPVRAVLTLEVRDVASLLTQPTQAVTPADFLASAGAGLRCPGLYSWWVDTDGARDLSTGLGLPLSPGLIYAGQAGATRTRSGRRSSNTLWGRISGMHLGGRHRLSTFRLSLGSVLAAAANADEIDELALTLWMNVHLRVIAVPIEDADQLDDLESTVLGALDPPLNLAKMAPNASRARLTALRRRYGREAHSRVSGTQSAFKGERRARPTQGLPQDDLIDAPVR